MDKIESIFKVMRYEHKCCSKRKLRYPTFKVSGSNEIYFRTLDEVEQYMQKQADHYNRINEMFPIENDYDNLYAYIVIEIPLREEVNVDALDEYLSFRIYLPNGSLWGKNEYGHFMSKHATGDEYNYWGRRNLFWGRKPEEIKLKLGDIVEILGCPGNGFWANGQVDLAIVVKTPPTTDEVGKMRKLYFETHSGLIFNDFLDTYEVVSYAYDGIDHAPTICVFEPTKQVSARRKEVLMKLFEKYKADY